MDHVWSEAKNRFKSSAYHDRITAFSSSPYPGGDLNPPIEIIIDLQGAESAAWNTLITILPRAAYRSALDSLLRHPVFSEPIYRTHPEFQMERNKKMMVASLKYFKVCGFLPI